MNRENSAKIKCIDEYTVEIVYEDHTLMNPLKWAISNNWHGEPVEFCGYNIPHPSDPCVRLSVQFESEEAQSAENILSKIAEGALHIEKCCDRLLEQLDAIS